MLKKITSYSTQSNSKLGGNAIISAKDLLMMSLVRFYKQNNNANMYRIIPIIEGKSYISLRLIDWFVTNYSKKNHVVYNLTNIHGNQRRFKVYIDYKLKLKAYSKRRFDPFCRWERINIPCDDHYIQTTIGQLNFFKWALENKILDYVENNIVNIEKDMNNRNSTAKRKIETSTPSTNLNKTRKRREELSVSAVKSIKKEHVEITVKFD